jgi:lipopolysaccharide biosynthesis protein
VAKSKYLHLLEKYSELIEVAAYANYSSNQKPKTRCLQEFSLDSNTDELCIFVSYCDRPYLKKHVKHHIEALLSQGIRVVLVINTDQEIGLRVDIEFPGLSGLYIRENSGYDFGAWSDLYNLLARGSILKRLYFVNDSMIGPLDQNMFAAQIKKIRESKEDFIGLTANQEPRFHLQSYFLVFGENLLNNIEFQGLLASLINFPTKEMVIDVYETRLTNWIMRQGYSCKVLYDVLGFENDKTDPVIHSTDKLLKINFPYIKTSIANTPVGVGILKKFT